MHVVRPLKTLLFIAVVGLICLLISATYPAEGINVFGTNLRFDLAGVQMLKPSGLISVVVFVPEAHPELSRGTFIDVWPDQ